MYTYMCDERGLYPTGGRGLTAGEIFRERGEGSPPPDHTHTPQQMCQVDAPRSSTYFDCDSSGDHGTMEGRDASVLHLDLFSDTKTFRLCL